MNFDCSNVKSNTNCNFENKHFNKMNIIEVSNSNNKLYSVTICSKYNTEVFKIFLWKISSTDHLIKTIHV